MLRPLGMLTAADVTLGDITIPTAFGVYPDLENYLPLKQAIGFAMHASAPDEAKSVITSAFKKAMASAVVADWAQSNFYDLSGQSGKEASRLFNRLEVTFAWALVDLQSAKVSPVDLGINKP